MSVVFALTKLFDDVSARFESDGTLAVMAFGWRVSAQKVSTDGRSLVGPRVLWIPGDESGDMGEHTGAKYPGRNPRSLDTLAELVTVEVTGFDLSCPEDERAQYEATRELYDAWYRAVYLAAFGTYQIVSTGWVVDKRERRAGATIRTVLAIQAMIPDAPMKSAPVDTAARVATSNLDVTEVDNISAGA